MSRDGVLFATGTGLQPDGIDDVLDAHLVDRKISIVGAALNIAQRIGLLLGRTHLLTLVFHVEAADGSSVRFSSGK